MEKCEMYETLVDAAPEISNQYDITISGNRRCFKWVVKCLRFIPDNLLQQLIKIVKIKNKKINKN